MYVFCHCYNSTMLIAVKQKFMTETPPTMFTEGNF